MPVAADLPADRAPLLPWRRRPMAGSLVEEIRKAKTQLIGLTARRRSSCLAGPRGKASRVLTTPRMAAFGARVAPPGSGALTGRPKVSHDRLGYDQRASESARTSRHFGVDAWAALPKRRALSAPTGSAAGWWITRSRASTGSGASRSAPSAVPTSTRRSDRSFAHTSAGAPTRRTGCESCPSSYA